MGGTKNFINNSNKDLKVKLLVRKGADPAGGDAGIVEFNLPAGKSHVQSYGDARNVYLNGIAFSWNDAGARLTKKEFVTQRGSWLDDVMNTNSVITWTGVGRAHINGSN